MRRGFSLLELVIAMLMICTGIIVLLVVFSSSSRHAVQSRNRTVAIMVAHSYLDEFKGHTFGDPEPQVWKSPDEAPVTVFVEARPQVMAFKKTITYQNGSCVNGTADAARILASSPAADSDEITLKLEWHENESPTDPNKGMHDLTLKVPMWR